jgi:uncharacterized membrane protein
MALRPLLIAGFSLLAIMIAFTGWAWVQIPGAAQIPTHWDIHGHADGHMTKLPALLIGPVMLAGLLAIFWGVAKVEPRRNNLLRSRVAYAVGLVGAMIIAALVHMTVVLTALGVHLPLLQIVLPATIALVIVAGNYLGKTRSNFFVGMRTPWTLESDHSWEKTNRWTGRLLIFSGIATLVALIFSGAAVAVSVLFGTVVSSAVVGAGLSYVFWREDPNRRAHDSVPE